MALPRHAELWFPDYVRSRMQNWSAPAPSHVWVALADHWEPFWNKPPYETAQERVAAWEKHWPTIAGRHADSTGKPPQYTFYYPQEEYRPEFLDVLAEELADGRRIVLQNDSFVATVPFFARYPYDVHITARGQGKTDAASRWWRARCAVWRSVRRRRPRKSRN